MLAPIVLGFWTWLVAIFVHELGHSFAIMLITQNRTSPEIRFGFKGNGVPYLKTGDLKDYVNINGRLYSIAALSGIVAGCIPILVYGVFFPFYAALLVFVYYYGCRADFYKAWVNWQ
jgi:hypothetical protein